MGRLTGGYDYERNEQRRDQNIRQRTRTSFMEVQGALDPTVVTKAEGIYFYDIDGNKYYDMSSQLVNLNIGFGNEKVADAIAEQAHKLPFIGPGYAVDVKSELASRIIELAPDNMSKVFLH